MKLRINVLTLMLGLLGGLFSCSQEELQEIPDDELICDVSLVLSMGDIQTKAVTNYTYATEEELTIGNCHVAVFEVDMNNKPTNRIHFQNFSGSTDMGTLTDQIIGDLSGYKLTLDNVRTFGKEPKKVRVLIVANADNSIFTNWTTYGQYVSGTLKTSVFNASALVKVGISDVTTLTYGQTNRDTNIYVSLNQLSAKIIYEGVYNEEGDKEESFSLAEVSGINMQSQVSIFNTSQVENTAYTPGSVSNTNTFYTYETLSEVNNIVLSVNKKGVSKAQEYKFAANKFIKGNLYKIKGNYIPLISFSITWVVEDMGRQPVTIPDFE